MIEIMRKEDLAQIVDLEKKCFNDAWNLEQIENELEVNPFSNGYMLKENDKVVAYAFMWETFEMAQIARIGVDPDQRKKHYGQKMMEELFKKARSGGCEYMSLEVRESNTAAIKLYEKLGFITVNVSKGYYSDNENAIVMTRAL